MKKLFFFSVLMLFSTSVFFGQPTQDIPGAKDHSLISRFKGSVIVYSKITKWDTYILPISKLKAVEGSKEWDKKLKIQGEVQRLQYVAKKDNGTAFIYMNYLNALKKSDWNILFSGSGDRELGNDSGEWYFYMFGYEGFQLDDKFGSAYSQRGYNHCYIAAQYEEEDVSYYASIYIVEKDDFILINQDIIKVKNPDLGLVTAKILTEKIDLKGHLALDGIFFETGKAVLSEKSKPALKNIADYLNAHKNKKFFIVGHTDNEGIFKSNKLLSEERAESVMKALVSKYGVSANQIKAYGVANLCPRVSNSTEAGRAKNRRVEIVEQ